MNIAVCDDESNCRISVCECIKESRVFSNYTITEFCSAEALLSDAAGFDIIFLDVEMGEINGIEAGRKIRRANPDCIIIYISSFSKYVLDSFDNEPLYYILKPINKDNFFKALVKAKNKITHRNQKLSILHKESILSVSIKDIFYIEYFRKHLIYHCKDGIYETVGKVRAAVEKLEVHGFILINQAILVNTEHIKEISRLDIILDNGEKLIMSVRKKSDVVKQYTQYLKEVSI